jgi:hypothetical protein
MLWGAYRHLSTDYRVHVHVVPASSPEVAALARLGLGSHQHYRLYEDDPVDEVGRTVAAVP